MGGLRGQQLVDYAASQGVTVNSRADAIEFLQGIGLTDQASVHDKIQEIRSGGGLAAIEGTPQNTAATSSLSGELRSTITQIEEAANSFADWLETELVDVDDVLGRASEIIDQNLAALPGISDTALDISLDAASQLDEYMASRFYGNLDDLLPDYKESLIDTARSALLNVENVAQQYIAGDIPDDLRTKIEEDASEIGIAQGRYGEARDFSQARTLGLTRKDFIEKGVDIYTQNVAPLVQNLLGTTKELMAPVSDAAALYANAFQTAAQVGTLSAADAMRTAAGLEMANAEAAWAQRLSAMNTALTAWATKTTNSYNSSALSTSTGNAYISGGASILSNLGFSSSSSQTTDAEGNVTGGSSSSGYSFG